MMLPLAFYAFGFNHLLFEFHELAYSIDWISHDRQGDYIQFVRVCLYAEL